MLKADDNSGFWPFDDFSVVDDSADLSIDVDTLLDMLGESSDPSHNHSLDSPEDISFKNFFQGESTPAPINYESASQPQNGIQEFEEAPAIEAGFPEASLLCPSDCSEPSDYRTGIGSECLSESPRNSGMVFDRVKLETSPQIDSPIHSCSLSLTEWSSLSHPSRERVEGSTNASLYSSIDSKEIASQIPNCSTTFSFSAGDANHFSDCTEPVNIIHLKGENENEFRHVGRDLHSTCASHLMMMEKSGLTFGNFSAICGSSMENLGVLERNPCTSPMEISFMDADAFLPDVPQAQLDGDRVSVVKFEADNYGSPLPFCGQFPPDSYDLPFFLSNVEEMTYTKEEVEDQLLASQNVYTDCKINLGAEEATTVMSVPAVPMMDCTDRDNCLRRSFKCEASACYSPIRRNSSCDADDASSQSLSDIQSFVASKKQMVCIKGEREDELLASKFARCHSVNIIDEAVGDYCSPISSFSASGVDDGSFTDHTSSQLLPGIPSLSTSKEQAICIKDEGEENLHLPKNMSFHSVKVTGEAVQSNPSGYTSHVDDDDADVCILEDISDPRHPPPLVVHGKSPVISQRSAFSDPLHHTGMEGTRLKTNAERLTFRVAMQDLSQPKSEASPPDGALAVSLLRHQRIALSWMVQKETASLHCSGGILADDQGLGKTISTIALILKERSPSSRMSSRAVKQGELESLNLDEDDGVSELDGMKKDADRGHVMVNGGSMKSENAFMLAKGRPAAGTLVVCPTSVLRQWADELHNKVTREANLSVLVYHGSNRTKDPFELAKYDVVLTTYCIVSMEVPKQPLVDKDDDEKVKPEAHGLPPVGLSSSRKRKYPPSSDKKSRKDKKGMDGALLDSVVRPLARVGWFRVVLDEAQSIKNHRTQVARACWGLRAKRRWCLSGTPIQNAVDDLYSYFRFLRYDPYDVYKSFCSMIKVPINRNPTNGYKKLQAVLKTIMLRRTKGTRIDGEPIINLPPKSVELKKVDFSKEERDFYSRLEADSRAQFKVYAAAGTVKQNYVNILLMLLRLRQACDHPLLVKEYDSNSVWRSSVEMAKKLPREKQMGLLDCLEACLAICGICNDPPEDAVVTICGHVFCNQCICEHLTGDDNLCPAAQCKVQLSVTSVFSRATLKSSLSDHPCHDYSIDNSGSKHVETLESCSEGLSSDSSKIKAALKVLQSLSKPWDCALEDSSLKSSDEVARCPGNTSDSHSGGSFKDMADKRQVDMEKGSNDPNTKVLEKAIVFSQWTRMLDLLEARLKSSSIQYRRLDGTMSVVARDKAVKDFNTLPEVSVMIMSLKAASLGLNMVAACHVLLLDLWWNPTTEDQAIDRAHRIGQTRPVTVLRLTVKDTVEDRILALQQKKREMVASAFGEDETGSRQTRLTVEDLKYLFMV